MIIKSKFTDYYDFIANLYGGGDPRITYMRTRLNPRDENMGYDVGVTIKDLPAIEQLPRQEVWSKLPDSYSYKWLVVAGKYYLLVRKTPKLTIGMPVIEEQPYEIFTKEKHPDIYDVHVRRSYWRSRNVTYEDWVGKHSDALVELSRRISAPVFCIRDVEHNHRTDKCTVTLDGDIPILSKTGIASLVSPQQMYQNIEYFMSNKMKDSPDTQPIGKPPMTDKEKTLSHGFDVKKSFRHRKQ